MSKLKNMSLKCNYCNKTFYPFRLRKDGTPTGITLVMKDNSRLNVCHDCICDEGQYARLLNEVNGNGN